MGKEVILMARGRKKSTKKDTKYAHDIKKSSKSRSKKNEGIVEKVKQGVDGIF